MAGRSKAVVLAPKTPLTLSTLETGDVQSAVAVKLLRKWHVFPKYGGNKPTAVGLVFADVEGTTIQAQIDNMHVYIHDHQLHEGHVYLISKFVVRPNGGSFRATRHNFKMVLNRGTIVRPSARNDSIADPELIFTPPEDCFDSKFDRDYLVDICGILTGLHPEYKFQKPSGETSCRMKIDLDNRGYQFCVMLFGEYVEMLKQFMDSGESSNTTIVLLWCKVDNWNGKGNSLQTTVGTTKLLINPDLPECAALKLALSNQIMSPTMTMTQGFQTGGPKDDFLTTNQLNNLAQVIEDVAAHNFVVLAVIAGVSTEKDWWYTACKCNKKAKWDSGMWYCGKCYTHVTTVTKKFFLKLTIVDSADSIEVVIFDNNVRSIIPQSCDDLYDKWQEDPDRDDLPPELNGLIGKKVLLKIFAEGQAGDRWGRQYKATNVSDNRALIDQYIKKWNLDEAAIEGEEGVLLLENTHAAEMSNVNNDVERASKDLLDSFADPPTASGSESNGKIVVDITRDGDEKPSIKRKRQVRDAPKAKVMPLKSVKIEK